MSTPKKPIPFAPGWNEARWKQLFDLEKLLNEVTAINHGSDAIGRIQRCITLAEGLQSKLDAEPFTSLPTFLKERALGK